MYRVILRCQRNGKHDYLYIRPIVDMEDNICSFGMTYDKYHSYNYKTIWEARYVVKYIGEHRNAILNKLRHRDKYLEKIIGWEIEEDFGTQQMKLLNSFGVYRGSCI